MLKGVSESARRHTQAFSYVPDTDTLLAGGGNEYRLAELIAEGGEGKVFSIKGHGELVAKVYKEYDLGRKDKLQLMATSATRGLRRVCAWPLVPLSNSMDETVGFVMESLIGWQPLHNAYQIRSRLKLFPHHTYTFLVRAARNLATCVHHLHEAGIVVGDLNESNVFVSGQAMVKLIDADSFQIAGPTALYPCKVGKAELMPPELQGHSLEGMVRTPEHDRFALAVLVFQTLVFGRHPFAGTVAEHVDLPLETCIARGYYAYTRRRDTPVKPPPYLDLDWLPEEIRDLFETAFDPMSERRPTAKEWYFALKHLETGLRTCSENPSHLYWSGLHHCPWCDLEDLWKIALFRPALIDPEQEYEVTEILSNISAIRVPANAGQDTVDFDYKTLPPADLGGLQVFCGRLAKNWGWFIFSFFQVINLAQGSGRIGYFMVFSVLIVVLVMFGLVFGRSEMLVRRATRRLGSIAETWKQEADPSLYLDELTHYQHIANDLRDAKGRLERKRQAYIEQLHAGELRQFLTKYKIMSANVGAIGRERLTQLEQAGIASAADLTMASLRAVARPIPVSEQNELIAWRRSLEEIFWKSHNYKLTIHQERTLIVEVRKENDRDRARLEEAPTRLEELAERLGRRQDELNTEANRYVDVLRQHGPRLLALESRKA
ncbi:MAG TPA: hypothetical protein VG820_04645 [Fimbriimonadaceae bacterium]|nr:hypothetical protein [Fimbriimonadaceae bacterium]